MTRTETMEQRQQRLATEYKKRGGHVFRLSDLFWAVESQRYAGEYHLVRFDRHANMPVDCSPVLDEEVCYGHAQHSYCSHSQIALEARTDWMQRNPRRVTCDDTLYEKLCESVEATKPWPFEIEADYPEFSTPEPEREAHLAEQTTKFMDDTMLAHNDHVQPLRRGKRA